MKNTEESPTTTLLDKKPKLLLRLCLSLVVAFILFIVLICIIAAELVLKFLS